MKVAVLGCSGAMGAFFVKYFADAGHRVTGFDTRRVRRPTSGFRFASSNPEAVRDAEVVLVAVPIGKTVDVAREVSRFVKEGSTLVEITSVKAKTAAELKKILAPKKVSLLSLHPLFGPYARSKRFKMCVVGGKRELLAASRLFPEARLILFGARDHDRLMAHTLSLVHIMNLAFASVVLKRVGVARFEEAAPPMASRQLSLSEAVLSQNPALFSQIQTGNRSARDAISSLIAELEVLKRMVDRNDTAGLERRIAAIAGKFERAELDGALRGVYLETNA